jgi:threonine aldolase
MNSLTRRGFFKVGAASAALSLNSTLAPIARAKEGENRSSDKTVHFLSDGLMLTPLEYSQLLVRLCKEPGIEPDVYLSGGSVKQLESTFAQMLGKESAVFVPTGTLANHLALRVLCSEKSRVLAQAESHIYCDSLDCVERLSHLNMVPLAEDRATFTLKEVEDAVKRATNGPFPLQVGAISIECPVRRKQGEVFEYEEMKRIAAYAREHGIKLHLDGARLFIASAYTSVSPAEYAALFDTVYISLYKYFCAGTGAVLAGPQAVIEKVRHARKLFGGGLLHAWPYTAVALHYAEGFLDRFRKAVGVARRLFDELEQHSGFRVEAIPNGTNICRLHVPASDLAQYVQNLKKQDILVVPVRPPRKGADTLLLFTNESLNRRPAEELARAFVAALSS